MPNFEAMAAGYRNMWSGASVKQESKFAADSAAQIIIAHKAKYKAVEDKTGVPWFWIGCVHYRESGFNWSRSLAQGDPWNRVSTHVPKGRGPFTSWEDAAIDALKLHNLDGIKEWPIERCLYEFERYNGFGYTARGVNSPYVWGGTTKQQPGKYVADGVWDATVWDKQLGCAAILRYLIAQDGTIADALSPDKPAAKPEPKPEPPVKEPFNLIKFIAGLFGIKL